MPHVWLNDINGNYSDGALCYNTLKGRVNITIHMSVNSIKKYDLWSFDLNFAETNVYLRNSFIYEDVWNQNDAS